MVCNLQGRESFLGWGCIDFGVFQRGAKKGERGFCPKGENQDPKNPEEVAWPNATEVLYILWKLNILKSQGWGFCHKSCESTEAGFENRLRKVRVRRVSLLKTRLGSLTGKMEHPPLIAGDVNHTGRQNV